MFILATNVKHVSYTGTFIKHSGHICCQRGDLDRWINVPLESLKLFLQCCTCLHNSSHLGTGLIQVPWDVHDAKEAEE